MKPKLDNSRALRIIAAAREEFSRRGFDGARVDQIARKAGVNKQLLFYYFHSKRGLFNAVLARGAAQLEQALAGLPLVGNPPEPDPLSRIRTALEAQFDFLAEHPELVALLTQAGRSDARPFAPAIKRLVVLLAEGQGRGHVRDDLDPHLAAAQALVLMVAYLGLESLIAMSAPPLGADEPALRERWKEAAVKLVLDGVSAH
ncbi:MAG: TetR/AcrR family transcriptional regulator [Gemmatimonadetes bacterium]|nr:MAG: TetR/AcrR family transcriptional regulator [Gemmatimonadota bacterium]